MREFAMRLGLRPVIGAVARTGAPVHGVAHPSESDYGWGSWRRWGFRGPGSAAAGGGGGPVAVVRGGPDQRSAARMAASIPGKANENPVSSSRPGSTR